MYTCTYTILPIGVHGLLPLGGAHPKALKGGGQFLGS